MNPNQQNQQQQKPQQQPAPRDDFKGTTYYLLTTDEYDQSIAPEFLESQGIKHTKQTPVVTELRVDRLTDEHRVIVLFRNTTKDRNVIQPFVGEDGKERRTLRSNLQPLKMSEPILCSRYWVEGNPDEWRDGEMNVAGLLEEIGKKIVPACVSWHPDRDEKGAMLRVRYA